MGFEPQVVAVLEAMGGALSAGGAGSGGGGGGAGAAAPASGGVGELTAAQAPAFRRTTHMFTATMPAAVERLAKRYMTGAAIVRIGDVDSGKNRRITQEVVLVVSEAKKKALLRERLASLPRPAIVFVNAKKACDVVAKDLEGWGYRVALLHSGKSQDLREGALAEFKAGGADILVATDVAGRGLDIADVAVVINYDMASDIDRFTHRVGRTGRAGKTGLAVTFLTDEDAPVFEPLKAYLESTGQPVPHALAERIREASGGGGGGGGGGRGRPYVNK